MAFSFSHAQGKKLAAAKRVKQTRKIAARRATRMDFCFLEIEKIALDQSINRVVLVL